LGTLSSGAGYAGPSAVSNYSGPSASQSNYSASSMTYPPSASVHNTPAPDPMPLRSLSAYRSSCEWDLRAGREDYDSDGAYTFPFPHPRSCSPASFPLDGLIVIGSTAFHIDATLLGELLHTYLVLVPSLPSLFLMSLLRRARFICLPLRSNFH
ncbi:hypothetical protein B0H13DRAFT_1995819, partial [Mycena leptocephala]